MQIQSLLEHQDRLVDICHSREDSLPVILEQALTGCMVVYSCLDAETKQMVPSSGAGSGPGTSEMGWKARTRLIWRETKLSELLGALRGQQAALNLTLQLLQM